MAPIHFYAVNAGHMHALSQQQGALSIDASACLSPVLHGCDTTMTVVGAC